MRLIDQLLAKRINLLLAFFVFLAGVVLGIMSLSAWNKLRAERSEPHEVRQGGYTFINPLLECDAAEDMLGELKQADFISKSEELIDQLISSRKVSFVALYYRDLNNGPWFGINEQEKFSPASLLKVPVMMTFLKLAETNPGLLSEKITYHGTEDQNETEYFRPPLTLQSGSSYTIDELISRMIVYSDNNAKDLLLARLSPSLFFQTFMDLGVELPADGQASDFMTVKSYASFFRVLFNASYLSRDMSEKALRLLSAIDFKQGIVAGVPSTITVSQKFGERSFDDPYPVKELHDCGIVYYPRSPYLICIMTRGENFEDLAGVIRDISSLIFSEVDEQHRIIQ